MDEACDPAGWRAELVDAGGWLAGAGSTNVRPRVAGTTDAVGVNGVRIDGGGVDVAGVGVGVNPTGVNPTGVDQTGVDPTGPRVDGVRRTRAGARRTAEPVRRRRSPARRRGPVRAHSPLRSTLVDDRTDRASVVGSVPVPGPRPDGERAIDGYRMGRWARLTLTITVLAAIAVVTISLTVGSPSKAMADVTVGPGDTLWSIAAQAAPDRDPRDVIEQIRQLNDLQGAVLPVGVVLRVPTSGD